MSQRFPEVPETHVQGRLFFENLPDLVAQECDLGIQIAPDGRVWLCINGIAFLRFSPHPDGRMSRQVRRSHRAKGQGGRV